MAESKIKKNATMTFYKENEQLCLGIDVLDVGLAASLLQARDEMWFPKSEAPKDAVLLPIQKPDKCRDPL